MVLEIFNAYVGKPFFFLLSCIGNVIQFSTWAFAIFVSLFGGCNGRRFGRVSATVFL